MKSVQTYQQLTDGCHWNVRKGIAFRALNSFASTAILSLLVLLFLGIPKSHLYEQMKREKHSSQALAEETNSSVPVSSWPEIDVVMTEPDISFSCTNILDSEYIISHNTRASIFITDKSQGFWWLSRAYQISIPPFWNPSIPIAQRRLII
jgi:hypothetical protein